MEYPLSIEQIVQITVFNVIITSGKINGGDEKERNDSTCTIRHTKHLFHELL